MKNVEVECTIIGDKRAKILSNPILHKEILMDNEQNPFNQYYILNGEIIKFAGCYKVDSENIVNGNVITFFCSHKRLIERDKLLEFDIP